MRNRVKNIVLACFSLILLITLIVCVVYVTKSQNDTEQSAIDSGARQEIEERKAEKKEKARFGIVINEICNDTTSPWVELYNPSEYDVDISGYSIFDISGTQVYSFPENTTLLSSALITASISGADLFQGGGSLRLCTSDNTQIDTVEIPAIEQGESYGRQYDGVMSFRILTPTKLASNQTGQIIAKNYPIFSVPAGFYSSEFTLEMYVANGYTIYYTLDGSTPTTDSEKYETALTIKDVSSAQDVLSARTDISINTVSALKSKNDKATVIRAIAVDSNGRQSAETCATYFVGYDNRNEFKDIPVISVFGDPDDFFGYWDGLLVTGATYDEYRISGDKSYVTANYWKDLHKNVQLQYFEADRVLSYEGVTDLSTYNDICLNSAQKSLQLANLSFQGKNNSAFDEFLLGGSTDKVILSAGRYDQSTKLRNTLIQKLMKDRNVITTDNKLCALFLNGEYWGTYYIQQKLDEKYIASVCGLKENDIALYKSKWALSERTDDQEYYDEIMLFLSEADMTQEENWIIAKGLFDYENLLDTYASVIFTANSEWNSGNVYMWRSRTEGSNKYADGKFRYVLAETDSSLGQGTLSGFTMNTFMMSSLKADPVYAAFIQRSEFRNDLRNRILSLSENEFSTENLLKEIDLIYEQTLLPVSASNKRFLGASSTDTMKKNVEVIKEFAENRMEYLSVYIEKELN